MSGGGMGSPMYGSSPSGSTATPWSAFGPQKSFGTNGPMGGRLGATMDPASMATTGGNMASGNFDPYGARGATMGNGSMGGSLGNFDPNNPYPSGPAGQLTPIGGFGGFGSFSPMNAPYMGSPFGQPQQGYQQPQQAYQPSQAAQVAAQPNISTQAEFDAYHNYNSRPADAQAPQVNYVNGVAQPAQQGQTQSQPVGSNPAANTSGNNGFATFPTPQFPTWLYGPTAGAFGGVTRPNNVPMNYGYFPGTGQWGAQPTGR